MDETTLIPDRALRVLQDHRMTPAIEKVDAFLQSNKSILVLSGVPGCGKTIAAAWGVRERAGVFVPVRMLERSNRYDEQEMAFFEKAETIAIDDLGTEFLDEKGAFVSKLDAVVDAHYANQTNLIMTTNLNADGFKRRYRDERINDRMRESGMYVELSCKSMRTTS